MYTTVARKPSRKRRRLNDDEQKQDQPSSLNHRSMYVQRAASIYDLPDSVMCLIGSYCRYDEVMNFKCTAKNFGKRMMTNVHWSSFKAKNMAVVDGYFLQNLGRLNLYFNKTIEFVSLPPNASQMMHTLLVQSSSRCQWRLCMPSDFKFQNLRQLVIASSEGIGFFTRYIGDYTKILQLRVLRATIFDTRFWQCLQYCVSLTELRLETAIEPRAPAGIFSGLVCLNYFVITPSVLRQHLNTVISIIRNREQNPINMRLKGLAFDYNNPTCLSFFTRATFRNLKQIDIPFSPDIWSVCQHSLNRSQSNTSKMNVILRISAPSDIERIINSLALDSTNVGLLTFRIDISQIWLPMAFRKEWRCVSVEPSTIECRYVVQFSLQITRASSIIDVGMFLSRILSKWENAMTNDIISKTKMQGFYLTAAVKSNQIEELQTIEANLKRTISTVCNSGIETDVDIYSIA